MSTRLTYPNGPEDTDGILKYADRILDINKNYRREVERLALRNILFYSGVQWIKWDDSTSTYRPLGLKKTTPKPVTNRILPITNTAVSNLIANSVPLSFGPASDDPGDISAATVADQIHDIIRREVKAQEYQETLAKWIILTGNAFLIPSYDGSYESGIVNIPLFSCQQCRNVLTPGEAEQSGICQQCGGPIGPAIDSFGQPMTQQLAKGRMFMEIGTVFSSWADFEAPTIYDSPYFMDSRTRRLDWVERVYGEEIADKVEQDTGDSNYTGYVDTIPYSTQEMSAFFGRKYSSDEPRVRVRRIWIKPDPQKAPKGIYAVIIGDTVVEAMEFPYHNEKGEPFLNVVHFKFDTVPGRLFSKTRVDDLIPKQEQRNRFESLIEMHATRMSASKWIVPEGVGIRTPTGDYGEVIRYNALNGVPGPTRIAGDNISPYIVQMTTLIDAEMDAIFGQYEVGRGENPRGVSAYAALQLLDERARQGQASLMSNWMNGWAEWARQSINIWREYADESRVLASGMGAWAIKKFSKADIQGGVDIQVDPGQNRPHTQIGRRAVIEQLVRLGVVNPMDPMEKIAVAEALGMPEILPDIKVDRQKASRENDKLKMGMQIPPPHPMDNAAIHWNVHRPFVLSEEFEQLPPEIQLETVKHINLHLQLMELNQMGAGGPGTIAPKPTVGNGPSEGTAKGDGGSPIEDELLDQETQGASPDTNQGV